ncbi:hypothetical protein [Mangrovihabitans endophyticus]|uniref:hypothetical protein n=1 Tax=Mangrovihabitans endophyticus TaxID=1751298 RepID=UPI00166B83AD|nr:hypothetical protein [Mangrovihabitans endophyticus]
MSAGPAAPQPDAPRLAPSSSGVPQVPDERSLSERRRESVRTAVEIARHRLRRGERLEAAELLDRCVRVLRQYQIDDAELAERLAYAHDRTTGNGPTSLKPEVLQRVIGWVTREELAAGRRALDEGRPVTAARCFAAADTIDPRGTRAALLHAQALQRVALRTISRGEAVAARTASGPEHRRLHAPAEDTGSLQRAERYLRRAVSLIARAGADPGLRDQSGVLGEMIENQLSRLMSRRSSTARMAAACACLVDYEAFVQHYHANRHSPLLNHDNLRSSVSALASRIYRLRSHSPAASAEGRLLTVLAAGIGELQRNLPS